MGSTYLVFIYLYKQPKVLEIIMDSNNADRNNHVLYQGKTFTVFSDEVIQGDNIARIVSDSNILSNYKSPASSSFSRVVTFKFSINQKDNENAIGEDHIVVIKNEKASPIIKFGEYKEQHVNEPEDFLPTNYEYTFRVDMSPVFHQFADHGYYECFDGTRIAQEDFKGVYIAGNAEPLTWDFVHLEKQNLKMQPTDQGNIYAITLKLNPYEKPESDIHEWMLTTDLSDEPKYKSEQPLVDALFNMSLEEALKNIEADQTLRTGAKWGGVWTRDVSYSIYLAFAYHNPEVAKISLAKKVNRGRIVQDTGSGGAWPVSSDRTTWAIAAWEIYKTTGDFDWLKYSYEIIKNTFEDDLKVVYNHEYELMQGESSFLDWREQTYPKWMDNKDIYSSICLGTNVVHYQTVSILSKIARILNFKDEQKRYSDFETKFKSAINHHFWQDDKGYYAQYLYGRVFYSVSPRFEALGESLAILFGVADEEQSKRIISESPVTEYGTTCIFPQITGLPPYHNNGIWPFVQAYWNLAAAKVGNEEVLEHGLASLYRAGALFLSNYENFVAENGDFVGTEVNSHRMLWSIAGNLAMVHRVFMGMSFEEAGIRFRPIVPASYHGTKSLRNFKYRNAVLNITVHGNGNEIEWMKINGQDSLDHFFNCSLKGEFSIEIQLANNNLDKKINLVANSFSPRMPIVKREGNHIYWGGSEGYFQMLRNGDEAIPLGATHYKLWGDRFSVNQIQLFQDGMESFLSEPHFYCPFHLEKTVQLEEFTQKSPLEYSNYSGNGFIEISNQMNRKLEILIDIDRPGKYLLFFRYSNGTGSWSSDNRCAIRTLYINGKEVGVIVFPQRGWDEWSDWGYSNFRKVELNQGENIIQLALEKWNINMHGKINKAMLDYMKLIQLEEL